MPRTVKHMCIYFTGTQYTVCKAGVNYKDTFADASGAMVPLPCLGMADAWDRCTLAVFPTIAAQQEIDDALHAAVLRHINDIAAGFCPVCHEPVASEYQVGPCVYGKPCGHRMWNGRARVKGKF